MCVCVCVCVCVCLETDRYETHKNDLQPKRTRLPDLHESQSARYYLNNTRWLTTDVQAHVHDTALPSSILNLTY